MGTSHSQHENAKKRIRSHSMSSKRVHSVGGTYRASISSSNTKAITLPVGNQYYDSMENPQEEYYTITANTMNEVKNKNKELFRPPIENKDFTRKMSESELPRRISLQHKHTSDITVEKAEQKQIKGIGWIKNYENNLIEPKSSMKQDNYVVQVFTPANRNGNTKDSVYKQANSQWRENSGDEPKQKVEEKVEELKERRVKVFENPYANEYGNFY